jgi:hypothetical protein
MYGSNNAATWWNKAECLNPEQQHGKLHLLFVIGCSTVILTSLLSQLLP